MDNLHKRYGFTHNDLHRGNILCVGTLFKFIDMGRASVSEELRNRALKELVVMGKSPRGEFEFNNIHRTVILFLKGVRPFGSELEAYVGPVIDNEGLKVLCNQDVRFGHLGKLIQSLRDGKRSPPDFHMFKLEYINTYRRLLDVDTSTRGCRLKPTPEFASSKSYHQPPCQRL